MSSSRSFGEEYQLTRVDRFGVWLSARRILAEAGGLTGKRLADFGCGYDATFVRSVLPTVASAAVVDVSLAEDLKSAPKVRAIEGTLPRAIAEFRDGEFDVVMCTSVLEHLELPQLALSEFHRVLAPGGVLLVNVPNWLGKRMLELSAFRLGWSQVESIDDHKAYYDPRDLWPLLVAAGFRPRNIRCFRHKFGLNTFAVCRVDA